MRHGCERGLTIIEIIVVLGIIGITLIPLSGVVVGGLGHVNHAALLVQAAYLAQHLMEEAVAEGAQGLAVLAAAHEQSVLSPVAQDPRFTFTRTLREDAVTGLVRLEVTVLWGDMGGQRAYRVVTLLAKAPY
jgi:type II secretory pathway pseudopilin PulG